jgi:D-proline reductase (dithiol) PrdB
MRLENLPPDVRASYERLALPEFKDVPWVAPPPLAQARVALVSTAGLHRAGDRPFDGGAVDYRIIPRDMDLNAIAMSHSSVNFDRSGFQRDVQVVFPLGHLRELSARGEIGSVAAWHYSFMGATDPVHLVQSAREMARLLRADGVTAAVLVPV